MLFTVASAIGTKSCSNFPATRFIASKPLTCPSRLQPVHQDKSCLNILHLDHMTQCHLSCAINSFIITCVSFATSPSHFYLHGICCTHTCTRGLITYVSHINIISPPRLSLNYQNHTGTFHLVLVGAPCKGQAPGRVTPWIALGLPNMQVGLRQASLGSLPAIFIIELLSKPLWALFSLVRNGGHTIKHSWYGLTRLQAPPMYNNGAYKH